MVFKRRDRRSIISILLRFFWPKGGWRRAFHYVQYRLRRLPDSSQKISRGIWAGLFTTFTPFYGLHFLTAAIIARALKGNILAALLATFFGNPLTYVPIGVVSLQTGHFFLGTDYVPPREGGKSILEKFLDAGADLQQNVLAFVKGVDTDWSRLEIFYQEVFFPYMIGGIIPGVIIASMGYYLSEPIIRAYQNRRKGFLLKKLRALKSRSSNKTGKKK